MTRYIALLRGINVGSHRVKMERVRALFVELGLANVRTYIQSGNVFFETQNTEPDVLTREIEVHLLEKLGYAVPVFLRTPAQLEQTLQVDAFREIEMTPDTRLMVVFSGEEVRLDAPLPFLSFKGDVEIVGATSNELFVVMRLIDGKMSDPSTFLTKVFQRKVVVTTRFYDTTFKILKAAQAP